MVVDFHDQVGHVTRINHCLALVNFSTQGGSHNLLIGIDLLGILLRTNEIFHNLKKALTLKGTISLYKYAKSISCHNKNFSNKFLSLFNNSSKKFFILRLFISNSLSNDSKIQSILIITFFHSVICISEAFFSIA
jgi:hypothetical protein